ncbi:X2-like carbohydrate binding domain-containing protein [Paenibacillus sp. FSL R10-2199]|uniref:X2-like carbohydrate binding domain-containing protein n=1 Tax=Paenibacillus sp. FSL R10-2199 TaxID=2975348 RepID=UPI001E5E45FD|nr:X2-like carbohydrate binding domain-containing protein [Paenibacillus sp. FSL P4-0081]
MPCSLFTVSPAVTHAAASEAYNWNSVVTGAGGGFVPGIIFNQTEPNLIYARTDIGGAYRWNQTSGSWTSISDAVGWVDWNKNGVDALATDPVNPDKVYMATGTYTNSWDDNGQIMRSSDRGNTWQTTPLPFKVGGNMPGRSAGERLVIDPNKNSILFFGARSGNGLWKSTDSGVTWSKVSSFPNVGTYIQNPTLDYGNDLVGLSWITFDKSTGTSGNATQTIYVGVADTASSVYRSTDGGATWSALPGQPVGYLPHHGVLSSTGDLYITYSNGVGPYDGSKGEVWKWNKTSGVWTNISPSTGTDNWYGFGGLAVDAQHPDTVMVSSLNAWWPDEVIFRSTNGGATWSRIWDWGNYPERTYKFAMDITAAPWLDHGVTSTSLDPSPKLGWMMGDLEIDPFNSNRMMYGTGATIYGSNNLGAWDTGGKVNISVMAKGVEETAVLGLISPPAGAHLITALGDVSGFRYDDVTAAPVKFQTSPSWATTTGIDYAELSPAYVVRVGGADKEKSPSMKSVGISNDGGTNWYMPNAEPSNGTKTTAGQGQVAVSASGNSILWSTSDIGVYYSKSTGNSWTASSGVPAGAKIASDRVNANKFYAFYAGTFYVSTDGGATFTATGATGFPTNNVGNLQPNQAQISIKAMPGIEGDIWFAGGNTVENKYGLWHSVNSGASFTKLANVDEADLIGFGKAAPGQSYMALYTVAQIDGVRGVFRSDNAGASWVRINDNAHQYAKINMAITGDPRIYGRVYLGTNGRGTLYADPVNPPAAGSTITPVSASFDKKTANQADINVTVTLNGNTLSSIKNGAATLTAGTDYTVSGSAVTIKKAYLAAQAVGTTTLSFNFSAGAAQTLAVAVVDTTTPASNSAITPVSASFDKKTANQADIAVTMTLNGNTLSSIKNGAATLTAGTDYTVSGSAVTISKAYLAAQAVGTTTLSFNFSAGAAQTLAVAVVDTTTPASNSAITPVSASFDKKTANQADIAVTMTLNGNTLTSIKNGAASLTTGTDYSVSGSVATISKAYLAAQAVGTTTLSFNFSAGAAQTLAVAVVDTTAPAAGAIKVQMYNSSTAAAANTLSPKIKLMNTGTAAVSLADVKIRYYYTIDGEQTQSFFCDWSQVGSANVTGTFVKLPAAKTGADYYLELGFTSAAGSLAAGESIDIQLRASKSDWSNYTQTGDYSFNAAGTAYADWANIPAYISGSLVWGNEPS